MKLIHTSARGVEIGAVTKPSEDGGEDLVFSIVQIWGYSEKTGVSFLWFKTKDFTDDIHGRAALGLFLNYGNIVIDLLWLRIKIF